MSVKSLAGELEQEYYHAVNRVAERIESLGLDPAAEEVFAETAAWFGRDFAFEVAEA